MKKSIITFLLITTSTFSQDLSKSVSINLAKKTEVFQIVEEDKKNLVLFFSDKKNVRTIKFDQNFEIADSITTLRPDKQYDDIVGYSISNNDYYTYWMGSNKKEIAVQNFNFDTHTSQIKALTVDFEKERTIKKITVGNVFYLINIVKNTSLLNIYVFKNGIIEKKSVDLNEQTFLDDQNKRTVLWNLFNTSTFIEPTFSVQTISNDSPPSLVFSANKRKVYVQKNKLCFTIDTNPIYTQTFTIDLDSFISSTKTYLTPSLSVEEFGYLDSNSFLLDQKIIQTSISSSRMKISIKNLDGEELKKFDIYEYKDIPFKNSDIVQENGSVKSTRILDKSNQLLRKINSLNPSVTCYVENDIIYLTLGGVSVVQNNNAVMYGGMIGGLSGALIGMAISTNYSLDNLNSYKNRKVVYINCLFDVDFNHIEGSTKKFAFDKLRSFEEENQSLTTKTVFKFNETLYFGGYNKSSNSYNFTKFQD